MRIYTKGGPKEIPDIGYPKQKQKMVKTLSRSDSNHGEETGKMSSPWRFIRTTKGENKYILICRKRKELRTKRNLWHPYNSVRFSNCPFISRCSLLYDSKNKHRLAEHFREHFHSVCAFSQSPVTLFLPLCSLSFLPPTLLHWSSM